jgi:RNA ligase (TIGR02306 family)
MSKFEAKVYKLTVEPHNNADTLEIARIGDYTSVIKKGSFKTGDLGVYVPEGALVPEAILKEMGLWKTDKNVGKGMLSGSQGNRVKAMRIRNVLSQGLVYPVSNGFAGIIENVPVIKYFAPPPYGTQYQIVHEGQDVAEILGLVKYEPPIPVHMAGEVWNAHGFTLNFDIENIKKYNYILQEGEEIVATEKLHGTFFAAGYNPEAPHDIVQSKGLGATGLAFRLNENNKDNIYVRNYYENIKPIFDIFRSPQRISPIYILGEIFGPVQDLKYGITKPSFRVFDIYHGTPSQGYYYNYKEKTTFCELYGLQMVPLVYRGPYSKNKLLEITSGKETISGHELHLREGVIIVPIIERYHSDVGRVILKSVSEDYLLRKNTDATEFT